jgi:hypothetical protein
VSIDVTVRRTIAAPRDAVAAYVMDHANDTAWIGGISASELLRDPPIRVGSRVRRLASFMGRRIEYVNEVVRLEPGELLEMRSVRSPFPMEVTYVFDDAPGGTRVSIRVAGEPSRWYRVAGPVLAAGVRRSVAGDLRRLEALLRRREEVGR